MINQLLATNFMNDDKVPLKMGFPFKLTIALGTRKSGLDSAIVLQVKSKRVLV